MERKLKTIRTSRTSQVKKKIYYGVLKQQLSDVSDVSTYEDSASEADSTLTEGGESSATEEEPCSALLVGDIIWSKLSGRNWWPSMIAYEPNTGIFFQRSVKFLASIKYHVQFFGEKPLRGWVVKSNILKFHGKQEFLNLSSHHCPPASQREVWYEAVREAEAAMVLDRKERKLAYVFNYQERSEGNRGRKTHKKPATHKMSKSALAAFVERRKSSRLGTPNIQKKEEVKLPHPEDDTSHFEPHNTRQSTHHSHSNSIAECTTLEEKSQNIETEMEKVNSICDAKTNDHCVLNEVLPPNNTYNNSTDNNNANVYPDVQPNVYPDVENSSDSGIEDVETMESSCDDMIDVLATKRTRKRKVFEGFHTGDEIIGALKGKSKSKTTAVGKVKGVLHKADTKLEKENVLETEGGNAEASAKYTAVKNKSPTCSEGKKCVDATCAGNEDTFESICEDKLGGGRSSKRKSITPKKIARDAKKSNKCEDIQIKSEKENMIDDDVEGIGCSKLKNTTIKSKWTFQINAKLAEMTVNIKNIKEEQQISSSTAATTLTCNFKRKHGELPANSTDEEQHKSKKQKQSYTKLKDSKTCTKKVCEETATVICEDDITNNNVVGARKEDQTVVVVDLSKAKQERKFCIICEDVSGELVLCSGTCLNQFHANCLGLSFAPSNFTCDECASGIHTCFVCSKVGELVRCSQNTCGKYYHVECLRDNPCVKFENKTKDKFTCPQHTCRHCNDNKSVKPNASGKRILKCVRCPIAYHQYPCIPAGCVMLTLTHMLCEGHYEPNKRDTVHINTTWCFICSKGGSLVCCDKCPASFHAECSEDLNGAVPVGAWQCGDCRNANKLHYGDIVWVKYSIYRWWPARICLPELVPVKVQVLPHSVGEFPVQFFGSRDFCWLNSGRTFRYAEGDTGAKHQKSYLAKFFHAALDEAKEAFAEKELEKEKEKQLYETKQSNKPPAYGRIRVNRPITCVQTVLDRSEWPICHCKADDPCKNECLNKMLYYECNPTQCPNRAECKNQRMQKGEHAKTKIFKCSEKGWGLKAEQEIKTGDFVIEYVGELIDDATCRKRIKEYHEKDIYDYYFLTIDKDNIIDAFPRGNLSRFMNHSCNPNCETQKWMVNGEVRVGLFATRDIIVGEELCFNYHLDCLGNEKKRCKCGSANCSGYLGVQPKSQYSISVAEKSKGSVPDKTKKKKKKKKKKRLVHEDECFSCGDGGQLLLCDRYNCTKAYHQDCLIMAEAPKGRWDCPWHFCDECGKIARSMCSLCPNSFCESHLDGQMMELKEDVIVCPAHDRDEREKLMKEISMSVKNTESTEDEKSSPEKKKEEVKQGRLKESRLKASSGNKNVLNTVKNVCVVISDNEEKDSGNSENKSEKTDAASSKASTPSEVKSKDDKSKDDKSKGDKSKDDKSKEDKSKEDKSKEDKSKEDKSKEDKSKGDKSKGDKSKDDKSKDDKIISNKSKDDKIVSNKSKASKTISNKIKDVKSRDNKIISNKSKDVKSRDTKIISNKSKDVKNISNKNKAKGESAKKGETPKNKKVSSAKKQMKKKATTTIVKKPTKSISKKKDGVARKRRLLELVETYDLKHQVASDQSDKLIIVKKDNKEAESNEDVVQTKLKANTPTTSCSVKKDAKAKEEIKSRSSSCKEGTKSKSIKQEGTKLKKKIPAKSQSHKKGQSRAKAASGRFIKVVTKSKCKSKTLSAKVSQPKKKKK